MAKDKHRFEVVDGKHVEENGEVFKKGERFESPHRLDKLFPEKFKRLGADSEHEADDDAPEKKGKIVLKKRDDADDEKSEKKDDKEKADGRGAEVTAKFKQVHKPLRVFERDGHFFFFEGEKTTALNKEPLAEKDVAAWHKKYMSE